MYTPAILFFNYQLTILIHCPIYAHMNTSTYVHRNMCLDYYKKRAPSAQGCWKELDGLHIYM